MRVRAQRTMLRGEESGMTSRTARLAAEHLLLPNREQALRTNPVFVLLLLHSGAGLQVGIRA